MACDHPSATGLTASRDSPTKVWVCHSCRTLFVIVPTDQPGISRTVDLVAGQ